MNKILYILRRRPLVQDLVSIEAEMEAHIGNVSLGTNTEEHHILLLQEVFTVCPENHLRIKLEKCESMRERMEYFDVGLLQTSHIEDATPARHANTWRP